MNRNAEIAAQFDEIADRLSLLGESWFKIRAYRRAAETMRTADDDIAALSAAGRLGALPGIGAAIEEKTADYLATSRIPLLDRLRGQTHDSGLDLLRAGLTPAQVREVRDRLGVRSLAELEGRMARDGGMLTAKTRAAVAAILGVAAPPRGDAHP